MLKFMFSNRIIIILILLTFSLNIRQIATLQDIPIHIECGTLVDNEFTPTITEHNYEISLAGGDQVSVEIDPLGDNVEMIGELFDTVGDLLNRLLEANLNPANCTKSWCQNL
ncbi:MAG: hypothetical protein R3E39_20615 [Anaerolineae bacterium]